MANRPSRLEVAVQKASYDGRFYGRYPQGNAPQILVGSALSQSILTGAFSSGTVTQAADWAARSTAAGVVWANNFDTPSEVGQFRFVDSAVAPDAVGSGVEWNGADGFAGGGCLELTVPTGGNNDGNFWQRPMSGLSKGQPGTGGGVGNGRTTDDPCDSGQTLLRSWDSSSTSEGYLWRKGIYANPATIAQYPYWPTDTPQNRTVYDGNRFFFSVKVKIGSTRWQPAPNQNPPGKLIFIDITGQTSTGEILVRSVNNPDTGFDGTTGYSFVNTNPYWMYTSQGNFINSFLTSQQANASWVGGTIEPGGPYAATCLLDGNGPSGSMSHAGNCWEYPKGDWTCLLFDVTVGQDNTPFQNANPTAPLSSWPFHDQIINVYKCDRGETTWTPISLNPGFAFLLQSAPQESAPNGPNGSFNAPGYDGITFHTYINSQLSRVGWTVRYTQPILSRQMIAAPQAW